jgi:hypothetical protein
MAHLVHSRLRPRRHEPYRRASAHARAVNDNFRPSVSFQYFQLVPMTAIFLTIVALVWIVTIVL